MSDTLAEETKTTLDKALALLESYKEQTNNLLESNKRLIEISGKSLKMNRELLGFTGRAIKQFEIVRFNADVRRVYPLSDYLDLTILHSDILQYED